MLTKRGLRAIFLFVAELQGDYKSGSVKGKAARGIKAYLNTELHDIDLSTEDGRSDAHENIWLERIYDRLDEMSNLTPIKLNILKKRGDYKSVLANIDMSQQWDIPIELDASALTK